jgi:uncharacterized protein
MLRGGSPREEHLAGPFEDLAVTASWVVPEKDVAVDLTIEPGGGTAVNVRGRVAAPWAGQCRRCLEDVGGLLEVGFLETFEEEFVEGETYPLVHGEIDLEQLVRETVMPELPQAPLCSEDCLGLCPECGANRNEGPCGHEGGPGDPRWAVLDRLRDTPDQD